jgi:hypothetical protein
LLHLAIIGPLLGERVFERWTAQGEMRWLDELKRLAIEVICTTVIGMQPGERWTSCAATTRPC